jgi:hypothetical protein
MMPIFPNTDSFDLKLCGKKDENNARLNYNFLKFLLMLIQFIKPKGKH